MTERATPEAPPAPPPEGGRPPGTGLDVVGLVRVLAVAAAAAAVFVVAGWTAWLVFIVALIVMVMVHEAAHMATAKWSGMKVTEFFVGFGPRLWSVRRGETDYGFKPFLLGGYVKIPGMTNLEEIDPADEPRTYRQQPFHNRIMVACAGSVSHFVMAFLLLLGALLFFGTPTSYDVTIGGFVHWAGQAQNAAQAGGLKAGDTVVAVNGRRITDPSQLDSAINRSPGRPVRLTVTRHGQTLHLTVVPRAGHRTADGGEALGAAGKGTVGLIGIEGGTSAQVFRPVGPVAAVGSAASQLAHITGQVVTEFPKAISSTYDSLRSTKVAEQTAQDGQRPESIYGAGRLAVQAEHLGIYYLLMVLVLLNVAFGILNMLPMLPFDGGHVAIAVYERIRTRRGQRYYQADVAKMLPVVYTFGFVVLVFVVGLLYLDITHPVSFG